MGVCPGEGVRHAGKRCSEGEQRVCAQIMAESGEPLTWSTGSFWTLTAQEPVNVTGGNSLCISMGDAAALMVAAGCESVNIRCNATDMAFVAANKEDATALASTHACLEEKCGSFVAGLIAEVSADIPAVVSDAVTNPITEMRHGKLPVTPLLIACLIPVAMYHKTWMKWYNEMLAQEELEKSRTVEFVPF